MYEDIPVTHLPSYGSFIGTTLNTTTSGYPLAAPVDVWYGIDFAEQPVGDLRLAPVGWPSAFNGTRDAKSYGKVCIQEPGNSNLASFIKTELEYGEDCLNLNVYRPSGFGPEDKLPVLIWIHGGLYRNGAGIIFDGASFVASSPEPLIVVTFNYRLAALGFLASPAFSEVSRTSINCSTSFADTSHHSEATRNVLPWENPFAPAEELFHQAIFQSGGPTGRSFPEASDPVTVKQFGQFLGRVGCHINETTEAQLACLRAVDVGLIERTARDLLAEYRYNGTHPFQAVSNATIIPRLPSETWELGSWNRVPALVSFITDEGSMYAPTNLTTDDEAWGWLSNLYPNLDQPDRETFDRLYPDPQTNPGSPYADARGQSAQFTRLSDAYADTTYIGVAQDIAFRLAAEGVPVWKMHWNTNNSITPYLGFSHSSDVSYAWAEPDTQYPEAGTVLARYYASFVVGGDPNLFKAPGAVDWIRYDSAGSDGLGWQVSVSANETRIEKDDIRREAIEFWRANSRKLDH
ncbi:Lipase 1, partial [Colletotrichum shisoi]